MSSRCCGSRGRWRRHRSTLWHGPSRRRPRGSSGTAPAAVDDDGRLPGRRRLPFRAGRRRHRNRGGPAGPGRAAPAGSGRTASAIPGAAGGFLAAAEAAGATAIWVAVDGVAAGIISLRDTLKDGSAAAMARLKELGLRPILLTGDNAAVAAQVAAAVGIPPADVYAGVLPGREGGGRAHAAGRREQPWPWPETA